MTYFLFLPVTYPLILFHFTGFKIIHRLNVFLNFIVITNYFIKPINLFYLIIFL